MKTADLNTLIATDDATGTRTVMEVKDTGRMSYLRFGWLLATGVTRRNRSADAYGTSSDGVKIALTDENGQPLTREVEVSVGEAVGYRERYVPRWASQRDEAARRDGNLNAHFARPVMDDFGNAVTKTVQRTEVVRPAEVRRTLAERRQEQAEIAAAKAERATEAERERRQQAEQIAAMGEPGRAILATYGDHAHGLRSAVERITGSTVTDLSDGAGVLFRVTSGGNYPKATHVARIDGALRNVHTGAYASRVDVDPEDEVLAALAFHGHLDA